MRTLKNGAQIRLSADIDMRAKGKAEASLYSKGTRAVVAHYAYGIDRDGNLLESEKMIRVETADGRIIHVHRDEFEVLHDMGSWST